MVGADHLPEVFGIELPRQGRRVHQVIEQHGELTAFRSKGLRVGWGGFDGRRLLLPGVKRLRCLERPGAWYAVKCLLTGPSFPLSLWERVRVRGFSENLGPLTP